MTSSTKKRKRRQSVRPPTKPDEGSQAPSEPETVRIDWLDPKIINWPDVRITSEYNEERSAALRTSMTELGQQDAVGVVQLEDGTYEGAAGMNRCTVAIEMGAAQILCVIRRGTHLDVVKSNLATSVNQSRANPLSEAEGIADARYEQGLELPELMAITGKSADWIEARLLISQASPVVKQCLGDGLITIGVAALLADIDGLPEQERMLALQLSNGWTVKELEQQLSGELPSENGQRTQTTGGRVRHPQTCLFCKTEYQASEVQKMTVCNGCSEKVGSQVISMQEGELGVPIELLREAETALAGSQAGAPLAERIAALIDRAEYI